MPIYTGHTWAWRNYAGPFPENIVMFPAGQYPGVLGWQRVETADNPITENNAWEYGENVQWDAIVWPQDITNVDKAKVTEKIITTKARRAQLYGLGTYRFARSVNFLTKVNVGLISLFGYKFKWPIAMED